MGSKEDTEEERVNWHWRNSMRPVRFFSLDARAAIPVFITLFHIRLVTVFFTVVFILIFTFLERKGLTFDASLRNFRKWLLGQRRPAWLKHRHKRLVDYG